jgi:hypothetical protein
MSSQKTSSAWPIVEIVAFRPSRLGQSFRTSEVLQASRVRKVRVRALEGSLWQQNSVSKITHPPGVDRIRSPL